MFYVLTHADGSQETVDLTIAAPQAAPVRHRPEGLPDRLVNEFGHGSTEPMPYDEASDGPRPLGAKRLPAPGEVWRNRNGALVAVMSAASVLDGGYNVVTISKSESARNPGHVYVVNLDGNIFPARTGAGGDLTAYVTRFDS